MKMYKIYRQEVERPKPELNQKDRTIEKPIQHVSKKKTRPSQNEA